MSARRQIGAIVSHLDDAQLDRRARAGYSNGLFSAERPRMQLMFALTQRTDWFHTALQQSLEPNGVAPFTRAQYVVIGNIAAGERRATNIARNLGVSRQAVSQILGELEKRGVLTLENDPSDGRSRIVRFKDHFEKEGDACARIFEMLEEELGRRIGKRRLSSLHDALGAEWGEPPIVTVTD